MAYQPRPKVASRPRMDRLGEYLPDVEPIKPKKRRRVAGRVTPRSEFLLPKSRSIPATWGQIKVEYLGKDDEE